MSKILLLVFVCLLCGCDMHVEKYEIDSYSKSCADHGGVLRVNTLIRNARCSDGTWAEKGVFK